MTPPKTLRDLLREHIDRTGDSYEQIAKKTGLSKPQIGLIATEDQPRYYRAKTLERISHGLNLPMTTVSRAAARSAGREIDEPTEAPDRDDARRIMTLLDSLPDEELEMVRVMVQALVDRHGR